ncbi:MULTISPECIES: BspA family leucine-rich repeat surface protein [unclassified Enterococcus]|uniref:BspA family leucine-rich repeat surface protein n=1 Tax=unclassified Enterococcus TaxID=2608891 RepID=UPI001A9A9085|nr:BspA family leucine-rich repeat surface protein [Enterococcus sp. DIV1271a]MBO1300882.1 BspA family leucine-rich repeat surface protein [Enterococcus sp. DIV1271a]
MKSKINSNKTIILMTVIVVLLTHLPFHFAYGSETSESAPENQNDLGLGIERNATITFEASPSEGGRPISMPHITPPGGSLLYTISANPNQGFRFVRWELINGGSASISNLNAETTSLNIATGGPIGPPVHETVTIRAIYERVYNLNFQSSPNAGGNPRADQTILSQGETTTIHANVSNGYRFVQWEPVSGNTTIANQTSPSTSITMGAGDTTIRAVYEQITHSLSVQANPAIGGNPTASASSGVQGATINLNANPAVGYRFINWQFQTQNGAIITNSNLANTSLRMGTGPVIIQANYERLQQGSVVVRYLDEAGNELAQSDILSGFSGESYRTEAKEIEGWELVATPENATGVFTNVEQTVTYIYRKNQELWGSVPWEYDEATKTIHLYGGIAGSVPEAPWKVHSEVEIIAVTNEVLLPENSAFLFSEARQLASIEGAGNFNTSRVTNMDEMFAHTSALKELDISQWDVSNVTSMNFTFAWMSNLIKLDVSQWDVSNVTNMSHAFAWTYNLEDIDVSQWNVENVTSMTNLFMSSSSLTELDLSNWDTRNKDIRGMFYLASRLSSLKLGEESVIGNTSLRNIVPTAEYTGRWVLEESLDSSVRTITFENSNEFMENYDGNHPGTYVWERFRPEELVAVLDPISDQSTAITGWMTEVTDMRTITYQNTAGQTMTVTNESPRIKWGEYQDPDQQIRQFEIPLEENERLATDTQVTLSLSKPSVETTGDLTIDEKVIKGIDYTANNFTLDRSKLEGLTSEAELHELILKESQASAHDVLSQADQSQEIKIVATDLTNGEVEDGTYFATLEVGNKAYQFSLGIDVSSKIHHLKVSIPTKMMFESLYQGEETNREFTSPDYEIRNHSELSVDTYVNQFIVEEDAGITLLKENENPLDHDYLQDGQMKKLSDIKQPLMELQVSSNGTNIPLYERTSEQRLAQVAPNTSVPFYLTGRYYGPYPKWISDNEYEQGGYYEDSLVPIYRLILRFVPRKISEINPVSE